jgi:hypothetical protein
MLRRGDVLKMAALAPWATLTLNQAVGANLNSKACVDVTRQLHNPPVSRL